MKQFILFIIVLVLLAPTSLACASNESCSELLTESWNTYKSFFIQSDGRVIDYRSNNSTTSEGQSYALLRAVWENDKETFDNVLSWSNRNLKVRGDELFGWEWGKKDSGEWILLDKSSATDADQDIAIALILAYDKWNDEKYLDQAKKLINNIWKELIIEIKGNYYVTAGEWAKQEDNVKLNPSYLSPYAYRMFAKYDKNNDWLKLVDSSYEVLNQTSELTVFYLPPNWAYINKNTGKLSIDKEVNAKDSDYSYDAIRTQWRISLDYLLYGDKRALKYIEKSTNYLIKYWEINKVLPASITADGVIRELNGSNAIYGANLPAIALVNPQIAREIYHKKLASEYVKGFWGDPKDYYAQNIIWFGVALWTNIDNKDNPLSKRGLVNLINEK
ncbi:MAG: glycosyl hydrolase family 8 [Vampirovibrionia bacterium]